MWILKEIQEHQKKSIKKIIYIAFGVFFCSEVCIIFIF